MMKVEQMINSRGNGAMNQFVITDEGRIVFQSYSSTIADVDYTTHTIKIGTHWDYSNTTGKHRNIFFDSYVNLPGLATKAGLLKAINAGEYEGWKIEMM